MLTINDLLETNDFAWQSMMYKLMACKQPYEAKIIENLQYLNDEKKLLQRVKEMERPCQTTQ